MAPKEPFKIHSLVKHIEDTKKGLSASAQYNRRPGSKPSAATVKKESGAAGANIFANNDDSDESSDSSDSDSDEESSANYLKNLSANGAKPSSTPKRRSRDEEIADSDVERNASAKPTAAAKKEKVVKKEASSSESSSDSSSESESEQSEPKAKTNGTSAKQAAAAQDSSSSSSEEESEDEEDSSDEKETTKAVTKKPVAPAATNGTKPTAKEDDSSSSSEDETSEEESSDNEAESTKPEATKKTPEDSSSESETSDEEESDDQVDESMHLSDREMDKQVAAPKFIAPDFTLRKGDDGANGQDVARICNEANLQGKQVWYFTVPSNVPISVIQNLEIPMDQSQLGDRIFSHEGQDYGLSFDTMTPKSSIQILIPSASDSKYQPARQQIDQTMHIKRITSLGGAATSTAGPAPRRAPRPQPKGLRARYQPFGVNTPMGNIGADAPEDEDVEMGEAPETMATPKSAKKDKKSKKEDVKQSKSKGTVGAETPDAKSSKTDRKGKRKHTISEDDAFAAAEQLRKESDSVETKSKKQKVTRATSPDLGSELPLTSKKQTPIAPPAIPSSAYSSTLSSSAAAIATPSKVVAATPSTAKKSSKKTKPETPIPTPRQTAVPLPNLPLTSRPKESPVPLPPSSAFVATTPLQSKSKKSKKIKDEVTATGSSQQSPPPSAQGGDKKRPAIKASNLG
ncbi:hypothetical protein ACHAQJ_004301 [Trichoderma viride]